MPLITNNIIVGADKIVLKGETKPKPEPKQKNNSFTRTLDEIKKTAELKAKAVKPEKFIRRDKQVIIEKRAKLGEKKSNRKSAYVRDMTTV